MRTTPLGDFLYLAPCLKDDGKIQMQRISVEAAVKKEK